MIVFWSFLVYCESGKVKLAKYPSSAISPFGSWVYSSGENLLLVKITVFSPVSISMKMIWVCSAPASTLNLGAVEGPVRRVIISRLMTIASSGPKTKKRHPDIIALSGILRKNHPAASGDLQNSSERKINAGTLYPPLEGNDSPEIRSTSKLPIPSGPSPVGIGNASISKPTSDSLTHSGAEPAGVFINRIIILEPLSCDRFIFKRTDSFVSFFQFNSKSKLKKSPDWGRIGSVNQF
ncbi:MAG: hypothetical protein UV67_C0022G0003 [Parcubacteria group bacterium GW2011_GWC1_43_12]|nr:MAG: hypothetical protein UV67_C0022G0003 [Parcubacteria group bacterium GW2011_GWC1_43_12]